MSFDFCYNRWCTYQVIWEYREWGEETVINKASKSRWSWSMRIAGQGETFRKIKIEFIRSLKLKNPFGKQQKNLFPKACDSFVLRSWKLLRCCLFQLHITLCGPDVIFSYPHSTDWGTWPSRGKSLEEGWGKISRWILEEAERNYWIN